MEEIITQDKNKPLANLIKAALCKNIRRQISRTSVQIDFYKTSLPDGWNHNDMILALDCLFQLMTKLELVYDGLDDYTENNVIDKIFKEYYEKAIKE